MNRRILETLMYTRALRPGKALAPDTRIDCRGCGRSIGVGTLRYYDKFRCSRCGRILRITPQLLSFRYTDKVRERQRAGLKLGAMVMFFMCILAVVPMAGRAGEALLRADSLAAFGVSAIVLAVVINLICYGTGAAVGACLCWAMFFIREKTQDLGILGAIMTIFGGLARIVFYCVGLCVGVRFAQKLPYGLVLWGLASTVGSIWRARLFLHL